MQEFAWVYYSVTGFWLIWLSLTTSLALHNLNVLGSHKTCKPVQISRPIHCGHAKVKCVWAIGFAVTYKHLLGICTCLTQCSYQQVTSHIQAALVLLPTLYLTLVYYSLVIHSHNWECFGALQAMPIPWLLLGMLASCHAYGPNTFHTV